MNNSTCINNVLSSNVYTKQWIWKTKIYRDFAIVIIKFSFLFLNSRASLSVLRSAYKILEFFFAFFLRSCSLWFRNMKLREELDAFL